jgi:hypothetical protein
VRLGRAIVAGANEVRRLLADSVRMQLVLCRPLLVPVAARSDVLRQLETLAGHDADLVACEAVIGSVVNEDRHVVYVQR